jgi:mycofactocin system glycosyltransferase
MPVPVRSAPSSPSPLRQAPPRASTPVPGSFRLDEAGSTVAVDGGRVLVGGSPLRLLRLSARGRDLVGRWKAGRPVGAQRAARLLARRLVTAEVYVPWPGSSTLHPADVTVVVPVRDRPAQLDRVLGTLGGLACVVVDDASHDAPSTKAIAEQHGARFIGLDTNVGPAGARNAGLAEVHSTLAAFVDSDCVLADGWLQPLLGHFDDPLVAAVAPRIVPRRDMPLDALARYQRMRSSLDRGPVAGLVRPGGPIPFVPSAALLVRADVAEGADLFDPSLRGGEDVDLVWRLTEAGWDVRYEPASAVEHEGPATLGAFLSRQAFYGSTAAPLARRHPGALAPVRVSGWSLAVWALALARRPALAAGTLALSSAILAARLDGLVRDPVAVATRIAGGGTVRAAVPALGGAARAWSPALVAGLALRRTRRAALLALTVPALAAWAADRDGLDPARFVALHVADDAAYGAGVWAGSLRARTIEPLVPRVSWRSREWARRTVRQTLGGGGDGDGDDAGTDEAHTPQTPTA